MTSPLYPTFKKRVRDAVDRLIARQVTPWAFMTAGPAFRVHRYDGREISYQGIGFEGSPRDVFWRGYIEPFLEHLCVSEIDAAVSMSRERSADTRELLSELQNLLMAGIVKIYEQMAEIDQRLLGKGSPENVPRRKVDRETARMREFVSERINAELAMAGREGPHPEQTPSSEQRPSGHWRNWGDHPIIVSIGIFGTLFTLGVTLWSMRTPEKQHAQAAAPVKEMLRDSPEKIIAWRASVRDEFEAQRQFELLYRGRFIRVSGKMNIFAAQPRGVQFRIQGFYGSIDSQKIRGVFHENITTTVICRIDAVDEESLTGRECEQAP